jgi:hypothetical protein
MFLGIGVFAILLGALLAAVPFVGVSFSLTGGVFIMLNQIYRIYFYYSLSVDIDTVCKGDGRECGSYVVAAALSTLTFGLYNIYWTYKIGQRLHANAPRYGFKMVETGKDIAVLDAFSFGFISAYELLKNTNRIAKVYNQSVANGVYGGAI